MKLKILLAALFPIVFGGGFALTLMGQGRLNKDTIRRTPVLGGLIGADTAPVDSESEGTDPETDGEAEPGGEEGADDEAVGDGGLDGVFNLPRPYQAEELQKLVSDLKRAREHHDRRREELDRRLKAVAQLEDDLEVRRREMEQLMKSVADSEARVVAARATEAKLHGLLTEAELERLRPAAKSYERIQPQAAAALIARLPAYEAVKLLAVMRAKKVSKVLEAMPPELAADLTRRLARLEREPEGANE